MGKLKYICETLRCNVKGFGHLLLQFLWNIFVNKIKYKEINEKIEQTKASG